jgi:MoaA/NifB/PqqE/SkfB family radical SAM enzyme
MEKPDLEKTRKKKSPKMKSLRTIGLSAIGRAKVAQFAVTNRCNCKCKVCSIWMQKEKISVSKEDGLRAIDKLAKMGVMQVTFTGGEPLMNPYIYDFIQRANELSLFVGVCVGDPRLLNETTVKKLHDSGPVLISLSFDTCDPVLNAEIRGVPDIHTYFLRAVKLVKDQDITLVAAPTITEYTWDKIPDILKTIQEMGFSFVNISYPTKSLSKTFQIGGEGTSLISLTSDQIRQGLKSLLDHIENNKNDPYIVNPPHSIRNMINFLEDPRSARYHCLGGWKVFAIDWNLDVYSCWRSDKKLGNFLDPDFKLVKSKHNACTMSWFRDFSVVFQDGGKTAIDSFFSGHLPKLRKLLN